jgi:di/tripeptidase
MIMKKILKIDHTSFKNRGGMSFMASQAAFANLVYSEDSDGNLHIHKNRFGRHGMMNPLQFGQLIRDYKKRGFDK